MPRTGLALLACVLALSACSSTAEQPQTELSAPPTAEATTPQPAPTPEPEPKASRPSAVYYRSCKEARDAGAAPLSFGEPGYRPGLDRDRDGVACQ